VVVRFSTDWPDLTWLKRLPTVTDVVREAEAVQVVGHGPVLVDVAAALAGHGLRPADLRVDLPTLEDVFLRITGPEGM
jgi:ABC-2 type transport system ATP-binding protein